MNAPPFSGAAIHAAREDAKAYLRIAGDGEDVVIETLAATALALCEAFTGQALLVRDFEAVLPASRRWQALPVAPVTAIAGLDGIPADGAAFALPADAYAIDLDAQGIGWARVTAPGAAGRVRVSFTAGLAPEWAELPAPIAQGVVLLVAHLFDRRDGAVAPPAAVSALWRPWRRVRLAMERAA